MKPNGIYFEDFLPGQIHITDRRTIAEADHVNFTTAFGFFEPLFMDKTYVAAQTPYKAPIVPGTLTFAVAEGLTILSGIIHGTGIALLGVELNILKPVFIGDTVSVRIEVLEKRETRNPEQGIVTFAHRVFNQNDEPVMTYTVKRMIRRQPIQDAGAVGPMD
ncbi:MAG: MaoC family dehydratase [Desulfatitalea sp.]|nr:MaoC family dehydratase [Desulfatitalea sp.]